MTMWARSLTIRFFGSMPRSRSWEISRSSTIGSTTTPLPMTHTQSGYRMPDGMSWNLNSPCSVMTVWPALLPPCERITMSALAARKSMTLPLPSSPHWPPTRMMTTALLGSWLGPARLQVVEPRVVAAEFKLDHPGRPIAMLGHDEFGDAGPLIRLVVFRAKQKHDNVTILFNATAFSEVAQDWTLVRALF